MSQAMRLAMGAALAGAALTLALPAAASSSLGLAAGRWLGCALPLDLALGMLPEPTSALLFAAGWGLIGAGVRLRPADIPAQPSGS